MRIRSLSLLHKYGSKRFKSTDGTSSSSCSVPFTFTGTFSRYGDPLHKQLQTSCFMKQQQLRLVSSSSSSSLSDSDTSVRRQLLDSATSELQRVKEYYQSDEYYNNDTPKKSTSPTILDTSNDVVQFLTDIDTVLFDCDGVLYRSPHPTPDAKEALQSLIIQQKKQVLFVTNNGSVSRKQLRQRITSFLQLDNNLLSDNMMISSAYAASQYLQQHNNTTKNATTKNESNQKNHTVFCIGSDGLCNELQDAGYIVIHANDDLKSSMSRDDLANFDFQTLFQQSNTSTGCGIPSSTGNFDVDAVVIGQDTNFTFRKLSIATVLLQWNPNALLIGTNMDAYDVTGIDGRHIPGNGSLVKAVRTFLLTLCNQSTQKTNNVSQS
jgi:HAD superfamily hydrolase (TIGR01450 family)